MDMKILFTASDRDLLSGYKRLLELKGYEVETAFDGVMAKTRIAEGEYDIVILDERLSRISSSSILRLLNDRAIPTVMLTARRLESGTYTSAALPDTFLCYPFSPEELDGRITAITALNEEDDFTVSGVRISPKNRRMSDGIRITAEEAELLKQLSGGGGPRDVGADTLIRAINEKLTAAGADGTVRYIENQGYRVVKTDE